MTEPFDQADLEVNLQALSPIVDPVAARFEAAGHRLYLVGGVVRDLALAGVDGFDPAANDIDLTTDARPAVIKELVSPMAEALWSQGERFGTIGATVNGHALEITTHRAEAYDPDSRKPTVSFGDDLDEDLSRRDFTINAAAIQVPGGRLHDPYRGMADLAAGALRTPLSPAVSFTDDPLRMLRAARFLARFELAPTPELIDAAIDLAERLAIVSVERINDELERLLAVADPAPGFRFLEHTGLLARVAPQFADDAITGEQRALAVTLAGASGAAEVRRAGLLWPVRDEADAVFRHLRHSRATRSTTTALLAAADRSLGARPDAETAEGAGPTAIDRPLARRIVATIGVDGIDALCALAINLGHHDPTVSQERVDELVAMFHRLGAEEDLSDLGSPLSGAQIMELLDIEPGPAIGEAQRHLREHRLQHGPFGPAEAAEVLRRWSRQERDRGHSLPWET